MVQLVVLELNEVNFESLRAYAEQGALPNFQKFFQEHGWTETSSEVEYTQLEPWIQWVTVHTGKTFAEHQIFRLGDIENSNLPQIWDQLEKEMGLSVAAICPMNAVNRLNNSKFFVPDPWTATRTDGPWTLRVLSPAISQAVNDNADSRLTVTSILRLLVGIAAYARPANYMKYLRLVAGVFRRPWNKVLFLDLFLSDVFIKLNRSKKPAFCTLFLNGAAHIQHHYMYNSKVYGGDQSNPDWYVKPGMDPVGDIYKLYDKVLGDVRRQLPDRRIMIATGLHQDPTARPKFYWRLRDHADFARRLGLNFRALLPRMSRDFLMTFDNATDCQKARDVLAATKIGTEPVFTMEHRDDRNELFVELTYPFDVPAGTVLQTQSGARIDDFRKDITFVALKNGQHNAVGYFMDSGRSVGTMPQTMPLKDVHSAILSTFQQAAE